MGREHRSLPSPRGCPHLSRPDGQSGDGERAVRAPPHSAPLSASGPATCSGGSQNDPRVAGPALTLQGASGGRRGPVALVPAGGSWGGKGLGSGLNFRPPPGADTSPPRPWEQLGKFQREPGSGGRGEKVRHPRPRSVTVTPAPDNGNSTFPLSLPAPGSSRGSPPPGTPAPGPSRRAAPCPYPSPRSGIAHPPRPHPPTSRSASPTRPGRGAPSPVPGRGERMAAEEGVSGTGPLGAGPRSGSGGARGAKAGSWRGQRRAGGRGAREGGQGGARRAGPGGGRGAGSGLTFSRRSRSPSSSRCRPCARSSASSACCCRAWILRFTASSELRPAMARRRGGARGGGGRAARLGSGESCSGRARPEPLPAPGQPRLSPPPARPPAGR